MRQLVVLCVAIALLFTVAVQGQHFRQVCQPNSVFKVECNTCRCSTDGTNMACTRKACLPSSGPSQANTKKRPKKMCEPGSYFKMDCNNCRCNDDGTNAACTLKACPRF